MLKLLMLSIALVLSLQAGAAEVYRWKDANGVMHFGDRQSAPGGSTKIITKESHSTPAPEPDAAQPPAASIAPGFAGLPASKIAVCATYAREMANIGNSDRSRWLADADKIKSACPGVGFQCETYNHHSEKDGCGPFAIGSDNAFLRDIRHDFPIAVRPVPGVNRREIE